MRIGAEAWIERIRSAPGIRRGGHGGVWHGCPPYIRRTSDGNVAHARSPLALRAAASDAPPPSLRCIHESSGLVWAPLEWARRRLGHLRRSLFHVRSALR